MGDLSVNTRELLSDIGCYARPLPLRMGIIGMRDFTLHSVRFRSLIRL